MMMPRLAPLLAALAVAALAACGPKSTTAAPKPTEPIGGPTADDVGTVDLASLGSPCRESDRCGGGTTCVTYYGIAGPSGPAFKSCEITCVNGKGPCPVGTACTTIADGPGAVCRPTDVPPEGPPVSKM
jgi:hypothetical protein